MTTTNPVQQRWLGRPGRPTAVVLFTAVAILAVLTAIALIDLFTDPLPPVQYGPFGDPQALTGAMVLMALFAGLAFRVARGLTSRTLSAMLLLLVATGPLGWGLAFLDSIGPDWINSAGAASPFLALFLLVIAPLVTVVGVVATVAEIMRSLVAGRAQQEDAARG